MRAFWRKDLKDAGSTAPYSAAPHDSEHPHRVDLHLHHLVSVADATKHLLQHFQCDDWFVACRNEHLQVLRLTRHGVPCYAVSYRCTPDVEKAVYHGGKTWTVSIIPLHPEDGLSPEATAQIRELLEGATGHLPASAAGGHVTPT